MHINLRIYRLILDYFLVCIFDILIMSNRGTVAVEHSTAPIHEVTSRQAAPLGK